MPPLAVHHCFAFFSVTYEEIEAAGIQRLACCICILSSCCTLVAHARQLQSAGKSYGSTVWLPRTGCTMPHGNMHRRSLAGPRLALARIRCMSFEPATAGMRMHDQHACMHALDSAACIRRAHHSAAALIQVHLVAQHHEREVLWIAGAGLCGQNKRCSHAACRTSYAACRTSYTCTATLCMRLLPVAR